MDRKFASLVCVFVLFLSFTIGMVYVKRQVDVAGSRNSEAATVYGANEATPKTGGTLRIGLAAALPGNLNPLLCGLATASNMQIFSDLFSSLVRSDETGVPVPDLAESWGISADGCNYTFHLLTNVTWHDSFRFNASDVKYTYDQILYNPGIGWLDYVRVCNVSSVEIPDEFTVAFILGNPDSAFINVICNIPIIPWHLYNGTDLATNQHNNDPVGTGPFKFSNWNRGINLTLEADTAYHWGRPYLDGVEIFHYTNGTAMSEALMNNTIDMIPSFVDPAEIEHLRQMVGISVVDLECPNLALVEFNYSNPVLCDVKVRKALSYGINRSEICEDVYLGHATPAKGPVPPAFGDWMNPNLPDILYNKTLAEQLLDEAGYPRDSETGLRFNLSLLITSANANCQWLMQARQEIGDFWQDIGVNTTLRIGRIGIDNFDCWFWINWFEFIDMDDLSGLFYTGINGHDHGYSNATVDNLFDQGRLTSNMTLRKQIYDELQVLIVDDVPCISLWNDEWQAAYNNDFHGFQDHSYGAAALSSVVLEKVWYDPTLSGEGKCPYRVCFTDSEGRRTGYYDGLAYEDIPDSAYSGLDSDPQVVKIREPSGVYMVELFGTENASYKFEFTNIALDYKNVRIPEGYIHENETITYIVKVFEDGSMKVYDYDKFSEHDVGVRSMTSSKTVVCQGYTMTLNVSVFNWGNFTENFNVTVYANSATFNQTQMTMTSGNSSTITFTWNNIGFAKGNYTISANVTTVDGELDSADNNFTDGWIILSIVGDITGAPGVPWPGLPDRHVDGKDLTLLAYCFGSWPAVPPPKVWIPNADINNDCKVDGKDLTALAIHFGQYDP